MSGGVVLTHPRFLLALLLVTIGAVYTWAVWHAGWVYEDRNFQKILTGDLRPIPNLTVWSFQLTTRFFGDAPRAFHLGNVGVHLLNTALVYHLAGVVMGSAGIALTAAFIFGAHPLQVESVAYITGRPELVSTCFVLITLLLLLRDGPAWLTGLCAVLAVYAKPAALFAVGGWFWAVWLIKPKLAGAVAVLALLVGAVALLWTPIGGVVMTGMPTWAYAGQQAVLIWKMVGLALVPWPTWLSVDHDPAVDPFVGAVALVAFLLAGYGIFRSRGSRVAWGLGWAWLALFPRLLLARVYSPQPAEYLHEHQVYLASIGAAITLAVALQESVYAWSGLSIRSANRGSLRNDAVQDRSRETGTLERRLAGNAALET